MGLLSDQQIIEYAHRGMIEPFVPDMVRQVEDKKVLSFGTGSYGYDARLSRDFILFFENKNCIIDPKDPKSYEDARVEFTVDEDYCLLPPHSFVLAKSVEYFRMPDNVTGICLGKSSYARCGLQSLMTPLEAGWEGHLVLEFANLTPLHVKLYVEEGIFQVLFLMGETPCLTNYRDRKGKYQGQQAIVLPMV